MTSYTDPASIGLGPVAGYAGGGPAEPKAPREKKTTRRDVEALFATFDPASTPVQSKAAKERERLTNQLDAEVRTFRAKLIGPLRVLDTGELTKAEATAKALLTLHRNATAAIAAIPDAKLDPPADKPKVEKPKPESTAPEVLSVPEVAPAEASGIPLPADADDDENESF